MTNAQQQFDVFLAHNSQDKPQVREIAQELRRRRLNPWLDEEQIPPGRLFQDEIQQVIPLVNSAAIFLGQQGIGRWQVWELRSLISQCVRRQIPVIPVLLPGVSNLPENLLFLQEFSWVRFSNYLDDEQALSLLQWGITGERPTRLPDDSTEKPGRVPDDLSSDHTIDYTRLRNLLAAGRWQEADDETYSVMLKVVGREKDDWITEEELLNFPCTDLRTIDSLWVQYSSGLFGFSVQKKIYLEVGGQPGSISYDQLLRDEFGDRVGWRERKFWITRDQVNYSLRALRGHLPWYPRLASPHGTRAAFIPLLASRLVKCNL